MAVVNRRGIRRVVLFLAITWAIAGSFLILQNGLPTLFTLVLDYGWLPDSLVMPNPSRLSRDCSAAVERAVASKADADVAAEARLLVWRMGFQTGFTAGVASAMAGSGSPVDEESLLAQARQTATLLGVDPPALVPIEHAANALYEFQLYIAGDPGCVAAQIDAKYDARQAATYKFALAAGHAAVYRSNVPALGPLFISELRMYGNQANVPPELVQRFSGDIPGATPEERMSFLIAPLEEYFLSNR